MGIYSRFEIIRQLGFTDYEAKCYLALFLKDSLTVSEIANLAEIPRPNAYEALERLLGKGLCISLPGKTKMYSAADPSFLRERLLENLSNSMKSIDDLTNELGLLYKKSQSNGNPLKYLEILKNHEQIHRKHISLCERAKSDILGFLKPPFTHSTEKLKKEQFQAIFKAVKRGVKLRTVQELPMDEAEKYKMFKEIRKRYDPAYEELRLIDKLPMKLTVYDRKTTIIILEYPILSKFSLTGIVIDHPAFAEAQSKMFEAYWNDATDYYIIDNHKYFLSNDGLKTERRKRKTN
jgi:HTH-type transcriptional regulator, sugar sensing transcriptional regulator